MALRNDFKIRKSDFFRLHGFAITDENVLKIVKSLESGILVVHPSLFGIPGFDLNKFSWSERYGITTASQFQLNLHALNTVGYLTRAYELFGNTEHLSLARRFIESWMKYESDVFNIQVNQTVWNGYCAALRSENLIYFALSASEAGFLDRNFKQQLLNLLKKHGSFLDDNNNYRAANNQGVYQNKALLYLAACLDGKEADIWYANVRDRISEQFKASFTEEGVHIENTYMYVLTVGGLFREMAEVFDYLGDSMGSEIKEGLSRGHSFLGHMLKPNLRMPMIGDTKDIHVPLKYYDGVGGVFEYAATGGKKGEKPSERAAVFPKSGYFSAREFWSPQDSRLPVAKFSDCVWTAFRSGCLTKAHKHADDLSFMLYAKGHDIFVDSGFYSFDTKNVHRRTLLGALSHNTVVVDSESYEPIPSDPPGVGICGYTLSHPDGYDYVCGFNNLYENVSIDRHFYYFGEAVLIFDDIRSAEAHTYSQLFHLGEDIKTVEKDDESILMKIGNTGYFVRIRQLEGAARLRDGCPFMSDISRKTNSLSTVQSLAYDISGVNERFVTLITIENKNAETHNLKRFSYDKDKRTFSFVTDEAEKEIKLTGSERLSRLFVTYVRDENDFAFRACSGIKGVKYAWYIYERMDEGVWRLVDKSPYSTSERFSYRFEENSQYRVKVFACTDSGEQLSVIAATINKSDLVTLPQINVTYSVEGSKFSFVNHARQDGMLYAWYVSRFDGAGWKSVYKGVYSGDNTFKYTFDTKSKYRVKAFILGSNGARRDEIVAEIEL